MSQHPDDRSTTGEDRAFECLRHAVQCNCHISDARHAGDYSLCIYLLKMREFFRWENGLPLTEPLPREAVGAWLSERESLWEDLVEAAYAPLPVYRERIAPFDEVAINARLRPRGLVYGSGIGAGGKPLFFLGTELHAESRNGLDVVIVADEHARDLAAPPAMLRDGTITVRRESLRRVLWERIEAWQWRRSEPRLGALLDHYGFADDPGGALERMTEHEIESVVLHEIGEARAGERLGGDWEAMLAELGRSRGEVFARAVRDHVADCLVTLPTLIERDDHASLALYLASLDGPRRTLFPALAGCDAAEPGGLRTVVERGAAHWPEVALAMLAAWRGGGAAAEPEIARLAETRALH
ncbi:MAG: hypothetical protein R3298_06285 [Gammaproteobacteria bacterium]|nr:hypothetical protein [Gammaproteobacteria bacterium]